MADRREEIADVLRGRILRGLHAGAVKRGDRLPSARDLAAEFDVDHRIVLDAYRQLVEDGLVELRPRGGIYVDGGSETGIPLPPASWLTSVLTQAVTREIPLDEAHEWFRRAAATVRLQAVAMQTTRDQIAGMVRELHDDYGLETTGIDIEKMDAGDPPLELRRCDLIVTTSGCAERVQAIASALDKPVIVAEMRPDLIGGDWRLLLRRTVYVVVADDRFIGLLNTFFRDVPGAENIRPLVLQRDSLDEIPEGAPVYITRSARELLGGKTIRGRILPTARIFSSETAREIIAFIVDANLRALRAMRHRSR